MPIPAAIAATATTPIPTQSHGFFDGGRTITDGSPGGSAAAAALVTTVGAPPMPDGPPMAVSIDDGAIVEAADDEVETDIPAREFESRRKRFRSAPRSAAV